MMKIFEYIVSLYRRYTVTGAVESDIRLMEYMTRMIILFLAVVSLPGSAIFLAGYSFGLVSLDNVIVLFIHNIFYLIAGVLTYRGHWRIGRYIPPVILFLSALYGHIVGGATAPTMLVYLLAITLVAILKGVLSMYIFLSLAILSFLGISFAHYSGLIPVFQKSEYIFLDGVIVSVLVVLMTSFLLRFIIMQYRRVLLMERSESAERRAAEEALTRSEQEYRELVQNAGSIILRLDENGDIIFCNEYAEKIFGYTFDEIIGKNINDTIVNGIGGQVREFHRVISFVRRNPSEIYINESEHRTSAGESVWINWSNKAVTDGSGRLIEILSIGNDVTERKHAVDERERMEAQLIHSQKMEAIGTLTSGFAHDFNNMLAGIIGSLDLLELTLQKEKIGARGKVDNYIRIALDSSKRASAIIQKLLMLSRKQDVKLVQVDINKSIEHVVEICRNSFPKSVSIAVHYGGSAMKVMADPILIEQIFLNFCVNASHAMTIMRSDDERDGGVLTIRVYDSSSTAGVSGTDSKSDGNRFIVTEIEDTGVGMDSETAKRIFEPFFTLKKKESGTGLGLSMAYGVITRLGGRVEIESEPGRGSLFRILIPESLADALESGEKRDEAKLVLGSGTILIIDDEYHILSIAGETLRKCGYGVIVASDGIEGIMIFKNNIKGIDAVILDVSMPVMSGFEVFERLLGIDHTVKVMFSSGYPDDERVAAAVGRGAGFIQKPYTAAELSAELSRFLKSEI